MKNLKKILIVTGCLTLISTSLVFANTTTDVDTSKDDDSIISSCTITGYEFTYENAPQSVKFDYEKKCEALNIKPSKNDIIFVNKDSIDEDEIENYVEPKAYIIRYKKGYVFEVTGPKSYTLNVSDTVVGYNRVESGNPVHLVQLLCRTLDGSSIKDDGEFGPATYNAVKSLQGRLGLTRDGIVGRSTWDAAGRRL
ncbi:peptidoglycan-binding domain-containing protein [Clostridioides difficile]|uniref:peptidoglycan-binding domain-containing protein n=1 Tax=Clostridioides difficile TaxID=1496 RepID=UPI00038D5E3D|nr:peptidoglycan-binding domain-containing protein [Clostridioides difficile]OFU09992.1 peptidoglycan-binding/hydrolyzing protein [Clostridium sp. HMSC19C11]OFU28397.1 peptidoglycan-binding/hydrolyzing protein [Clostridium sp. HMSC19B11]AXU50642.1 peptidoglycan-binding/hydrolysing protein [Clostridioides difficile]AXU65113.1 peptidoglycan-binding/hydrolysing protein [Clostridioides difficile]EGT3706904.1 peptidoglycan-binding protein [Clostridioides difficile]